MAVIVCGAFLGSRDRSLAGTAQVRHRTESMAGGQLALLAKRAPYLKTFLIQISLTLVPPLLVILSFMLHTYSSCDMMSDFPVLSDSP